MQVTGGQMFPLDSHLRSVMVFGHNFTGKYSGNSNGKYVKKAQLFQIIDNGRDLRVQTRKSENPNSAYRRRDLNVLPMILGNKRALVGFSGVFTEKKGCWTVPVEIYEDGTTNMDNPLNSETFKQSMNIYTCASSTIYSPSLDENYFILLGGITFRFFNGINFETDSRFPFNNQLTTIRRESSGNYKQYFMNDRYPVIKSTGPNPGNELLFGATAIFYR